MAAKPETDAQAAGEEAGQAPSRKKKIILLALVLVILVVAGAGGWLYMSRQNALDEGEEEVKTPAKAEPKGPPTYLPLDVMVVNLADPGGERVAQVGVTLELSDPKATEKVKSYVPAIRSSALLLVSQKKAEELLSREGKDQLAAEILAEATSHFPAEPGKAKEQPENPVRRILFTNFIVQ